jgi:pilus assembly protein Flp/PilA
MRPRRGCPKFDESFRLKTKAHKKWFGNENTICLHGDIGAIAMAKFKSFLGDQSGATAIEYALIAGSISIVMVAALNGIGSKLNSTFTNVSNGFR